MVLWEVYLNLEFYFTMGMEFEYNHTDMGTPI